MDMNGSVNASAASTGEAAASAATEHPRKFKMSASADVYAKRMKEKEQTITSASFTADKEKIVDSSTSEKKRKRGRPPGSKTKNRNPAKHGLSVKKRKGESFIDLTGVPSQPLILKNDLSHTHYKDNSRTHPVAEGSSKYTGVYLDKKSGKWKAQIMVDGIVRSIGYYVSETEAAGDYARAAFKYKTKGTTCCYGGLDLSSVPDQPLILNEKSASGYKGVKKNKDRWEARITTKKGSTATTLGTFDDKEEAARIYSRASFYLEQNERKEWAAV